jgi:hypothetical protein
MEDTSDTLLPNHRHMLEVESGIAPEIIAERLYRSITDTEVAALRALGFARSQCQVPGLLIPLHHVSDEVLTAGGKEPAHFQFRPDEPRLNDSGRPIKYETPYGCRPCLDIPPRMRHLLADPAIPLLITEGAKKADSAASHDVLCLNVTGVYGWLQAGEDGQESLPLSDWDHIKLRGRRVEIAYDSDITVKPEVKRASTRLAEMLRSRGAKVVVLYLPNGPAGEKTGLDDYFVRGGTVSELHTLTRRPEARTTPDGIDPNLPKIRTTNRQLRDIVDECLRALVTANEPPQIFEQGGRLARLQRSETVSGERITIEPIGRDSMMERLSRVANFVSLSETGERSVSPTDNAVRTLLALPEYPYMPHLDGIVSSPVFATDGTLCDEPGYSPDSRLYYHEREPLRLPDTTPTRKNIRGAVRLIFEELLADFPFADDASRAHTLAMFLLAFMRSMVDGPTPLHLIDAPRPGTGKSLLAMTVSLVFEPSGVPARSTPNDEAEWKKQMMTWLRQGSSHLLLDNVRSLRTATLESVLTSREWSDRLLGVNQDGRYPNRCVWMATSNNMVSSREQLRRCVWIRLDARTERPDERSGFKHPDLHQWVMQHRAELVGAAVTLVRAWIVAGQPAFSGVAVLGSFEAWTRVMGGLLDVVGVKGFLANQRQLIEEADDEGGQFAVFVARWWGQFRSKPVSATSLLPLASQHLGLELSDRSPQRSLGRILMKHRDNMFGDKVIRVKSDPKSHSMYYLCPTSDED